MLPTLLEERKACLNSGHYEDRPVVPHSDSTTPSTDDILVYLHKDSHGIFHVRPVRPISVTSNSIGKRLGRGKRKLEADGWKRYTEQENHASEQDTGTSAEERSQVKGKGGVEEEDGENGEDADTPTGRAVTLGPLNVPADSAFRYRH